MPLKYAPDLCLCAFSRSVLQKSSIPNFVELLDIHCSISPVKICCKKADLTPTLGPLPHGTYPQQITTEITSISRRYSSLLQGRHEEHLSPSFCHGRRPSTAQRNMPVSSADSLYFSLRSIFLRVSAQ